MFGFGCGVSQPRKERGYVFSVGEKGRVPCSRERRPRTINCGKGGGGGGETPRKPDRERTSFININSKGPARGRRKKGDGGFVE